MFGYMALHVRKFQVTMGVDKAGAKNAGIFAVQVLALTDARLDAALGLYRREMDQEVEAKDAALQG